MNKADVSTPSPRMAELEHKRELVRTIMGGTFAMRGDGEKYLPKHPAESPGVYKTRLQKTFLDNFVGMAIEKATGKLFAKPVQLEGVPTATEGLLENIDRQGRCIEPFLMDVCNRAFEDGISYVMADMPQVEGVQSLADEKALGVRPYAVHIHPRNVIEILPEMIGGTETVTRLRVRETVTAPDGWAYSTVEQIRVWYRESGTESPVIRWELYRRNDKKEWLLHDEGLTTFKSIYIVPFYTNRTGFMEGLPPFQNTAESNLEHWQTKSEFAHSLSLCCFGMLTATGVNIEDEIEVGPAKILKANNPDAKFSYTETTGTGVTLSAEALKAIESRIESAGVNLRVENAGNVTATAAALDSEDTHAALKAIAKSFSDSTELLLSYFAEIMGLDVNNAGEVKINDDFGAAKGTQAGLQEINKSRAMGDISRNQWISELKRRGELDAGFNLELNAEELSNEGPALSSIGND